MRKAMTFAIAVLLSAPLVAGDLSMDELVVQAKDHIHDYSLTPPDSIGGAIEQAVPSATNAREVVAIVRDRFALKEETARLITTAVLRTLVSELSTGGQPLDEYEALVRSIDRDYSDALRSDPSNPAVAREYLVRLAGNVDRFPNDVDGVLRGLPRERRGFVALQVMSDLRVHQGHPALFDAVTQSFGLDPLAMAITADDLSSSSSAEIFDRAAALWLAQKDIPSAAAAASRAIYAYANRRSLADVLRVYRKLPADAKAIVSSVPPDEAMLRSRGMERPIRTRDIRFTLAAALILSGDNRAALPLLRPTRAKDDPHAEAQMAVRAMLMAAIDAPGGDAFDLVTTYLQNGDETASGLVDEVFDRVATRAGYAIASKWRHDEVTRAEARLGAIERAALPPALAALVPMCDVPAEEGISPAVARLLAPTPLVPFVEHPVDDSARSAQPVTEETLGCAVGALEGLSTLRVDARGNEVVALVASQDVDPAGEISVGGYWILRSTDRGTTWRPPLYTGLRMMQPYEVVVGSTLPMLMDDGVRIEVNVNELDPASITFPPVALRAMRTKEGIAVDLKWRDLEHDSDGDGLTDLVEERILTDPNSSDTDGDGIPDGVDPLPQVAFHKPAGPVADIVAAALDAYYGRVEAGAKDARTIFVAGDPADFAGLRRMRVIVVSEEEIAAATKKFGPTLPLHMSPVIIDHSGTRAWVEMNDEWRGASYLLQKKNGVWILFPAQTWIT